MQQPPAPPAAPTPPGIDYSAEPAPPPPGGPVFTEYLDDTAGRTYFVSDDGTTTWERPQHAHVVRSESVVEWIASKGGVVGI